MYAIEIDTKMINNSNEIIEIKILIKATPIIKFVELLNEYLNVFIIGLPLTIAFTYDAENNTVIGNTIKSVIDFKNLPINGMINNTTHTDRSNTKPNNIPNNTSAKTHFKIFKLQEWFN